VSAAVTLGDMRPRSKGVVVGYDADQLGARRFAEMGLVPGAVVTVVAAAPLGDPVEYAVGGSLLSIRKDDARAVIVEESRD